MSDENNVSPALRQMALILDCFSTERPELGVREAARLTGLSRSAVGRLMNSMKELRILAQDPVHKNYSLGVRVLEWGGVYLGSLDFRLKALPTMHHLQEESQESISLYIVNGMERVCVERLESNQTVRIITRVGRRLPLYAGSAGKAILAFLPEARRKDLLDAMTLNALTENTITDRMRLEAELEQVRKQGYALSHGEWILDASGVAAPILGMKREVLGAVTISGPTQRFTPDRVAVFSRLIVEGAAQISLQMGYRVPL